MAAPAAPEVPGRPVSCEDRGVLGQRGQLFGAVFFGWLAERVGRLRVLFFTIVLFVAMDLGCLFATGAWMMIILRFIQGIGTGGEVPVAIVVARGEVEGEELMAWMNARVAAHKRLHDVRFADRLPRTPAGKLLRRALCAQPSYA